jgi:hypothetical protein
LSCREAMSHQHDLAAVKRGAQTTGAPVSFSAMDLDVRFSEAGQKNQKSRSLAASRPLVMTESKTTDADLRPALPWLAIVQIERIQFIAAAIDQH